MINKDPSFYYSRRCNLKCHLEKLSTNANLIKGHEIPMINKIVLKTRRQGNGDTFITLLVFDIDEGTKKTKITLKNN